MTVKRPRKVSSALTIRIGAELDRSLAREARRSRKTKSELAREILAAGLAGEEAPDPAAEARRQSLLVSRRRSERDTLDFLEHAADTRGWK
ncbi:MAG TPA: antitoxin MazE-like protein [Thermoanaerobaculia bacterium]|nr:antitoxin MazE-like protein [Thermoanaerobaculia bacterium]